MKRPGTQGNADGWQVARRVYMGEMAAKDGKQAIPLTALAQTNLPETAS